MSQRLWLAAILFSACTTGPAPFDTDTLSSDDNDDTDIPDIVYPDRDGDGSTSDEDCDDQNPLVNPDQEEVCNGADDDCDGLSDATSSEKEGFTAAFQDADIDAYGGESTQRWFCTVPSGWTLQGGDCDDSNAARNPGAIEVCNGVDDDCDSAADDDDDSLIAAGHPTAVQRFPDGDGDGFGLGTQRWYCTEPSSGTAPNGTDCDDNDRFAFPGSAERESSSSCRRDADGDGYGSANASGSVVPGSDCNDALSAAFPGSAERESSTSCRLDADGDGYGSSAVVPNVSFGTDCNDGVASINPGASEVWYDGTDANCDGRDDWDQDNDGYFAPSKPGGGNDCNDTSASIKPTAIEVCNSIDDDCDAAIDDNDPNVSVTAPWYLDNDGDGYAGTVVRTCAKPAGGVNSGPDCDDTKNTTFPGAAERESSSSCRADVDADGYGDAFAPSPVVRGADCDDLVAVTFPGSAEKESTTSCRTDADGDGYGTRTPVSNVTAGGDCNDGSDTIRPGATETWYDGVDQNCDGVDDWDQDGDGAPATSKPSGGTDCVDTDAAIKPSATEICDTIDNDCDTLIDDADGGVSVTVFWYVDTDGDTFAGSANPVRTCSQPPGGVRLAQATDCDDTKATTFVGAAERESATACRADADGDGYGATTAPPGGTAGTDCDDTLAAAFPGSAERESSSSCRLDADGDGYGATVKPAAVTAGGDCDDAVATTFPGAAQTESSSACRADADDDGYGSTTPPSGGTAGADCDDGVAAVKPGATDVWYDGVDQNCDGKSDWDQDGDGFDALTAVDGDDCDDLVAELNPDAPEVCDAIDNDCDNDIDDADADLVVTEPWGEDLDGDGFPGAGTLFETCVAASPDLLRLDGTNADCDDDDDRTYVGAASEESTTLCMTDADEDGWGSDLPLAGIDIGNDCDDLDVDVNPDAPEVWYDGVDQDCDVSTEWDQDADGVPKTGAPGGGTDCDDTSAAFGSSTLDPDCDGAVDTADCYPDDASKQCVVQQVAAGYAHTCAVFDGGRVRCWGIGSDGRLGYGATISVGDNETPSSAGDVPVGAPVKQLALGYAHTCALRTDGTVSCWGDGFYGQLGYGNTTDIGDNELASAAGTVNVGAPVVAITAGFNHTCVLTTAGAVKCWGANSVGELGYGNTTPIGDNETPASVGAVSVGAGTVTQLVAGGSYTCVRFANGTVRCWGLGGHQLGYGYTSNIGDNELPSSVGTVSVSATSTVTQLAVGIGHTCARMSDMSVRCWGYNGNGQLGLGNTNAIGDEDLPSSLGASGAVFDAVSVSVGEYHTCVLQATGGVRCWGYALDGQLGFGNTTSIGDNEVPSGTVNTGVNARFLVSGKSHNCVIGVGALEPLRCWGWGPHGRLGYGNTNNIGDNELPYTAGDVSFR